MSLFKKKPTLRDKCLEMYGEEFVKKYDLLTSGQSIGNYEETIEFLHKVDKADKALRGK